MDIDIEQVASRMQPNDAGAVDKSGLAAQHATGEGNEGQGIYHAMMICHRFEG